MSLAINYEILRSAAEALKTQNNASAHMEPLYMELHDILNKTSVAPSDSVKFLGENVLNRVQLYAVAIKLNEQLDASNFKKALILNLKENRKVMVESSLDVDILITNFEIYLRTSCFSEAHHTLTLLEGYAHLMIPTQIARVVGGAGALFRLSLAPEAALVRLYELRQSLSAFTDTKAALAFSWQHLLCEYEQTKNIVTLYKAIGSRSELRSVETQTEALLRLFQNSANKRPSNALTIASLRKVCDFMWPELKVHDRHLFAALETIESIIRDDRDLWSKRQRLIVAMEQSSKTRSLENYLIILDIVSKNATRLKFADVASIARKELTANRAKLASY